MGADLITLDEYKASEGLESLKEDSKIQSLITSVSQLVKTYCANSFVDYVSVDKIETFNITDPYTTRVQLSESPLISVTSVEERDTYSSAYTALTEGNYEFYADLTEDTVYRTNTMGYATWKTGPGSVRVTYKAGYNTLPEDLKLAVIDLINYYKNDEYKPRRTMGGTSISNDPSSTQWRNVGFPDHIKRVLDLHKNINV